MNWPLAGMIVIVLLWLAIVVTSYTFSKISAQAAWLLVPYFLWVSYAAALNISKYFLNR